MQRGYGCREKEAAGGGGHRSCWLRAADERERSGDGCGGFCPIHRGRKVKRHGEEEGGCRERGVLQQPLGIGVRDAAAACVPPNLANTAGGGA